MTVTYAYTSPVTANASVHGYLLQPVLEALRAAGSVGTLLDVGCGNGAFTKLLYGAAERVYGVDTSASGVRHAAVNLGRENTCVVDDDSEFRGLFGVQQWDAIVSVEVVEHLYDPRAYVARCREALRPGGSLVVTTPYHGHLKWLALALTGKALAHADPLWDGGHIKLWSRDTLTRLLEEAGFRVVSFAGAGRLPWMWKSMVLRAVRNQ